MWSAHKQIKIMIESVRVSVIITTYNHAHYLPQSIESVLRQNYQNKELIVVDDGSSDNTKEVVGRYLDVKYVYQSNQGLSAARNTGIDNSNGECVVFLDADDWFFDNALREGATALEANPQAAFAYGAYRTVNNDGEIIPEKFDNQDLSQNAYTHLLQNNFIAMHATVLYRRWVFELFRFDRELKACEDYDLYLKITRTHPIIYHQHIVAAYRRHSQNMSGSPELMLSAVFKVLQRQVPFLRNEQEKNSLVKGREFWRNFYGKMLYRQLGQSAFFSFQKKRIRQLSTLFIFNKKIFLKYLYIKSFMGMKSILKKKSPGFVLSFMHDVGLYKGYKPGVGKIRRGDFTTTKPFSTNFGYDRGGPVDRYYIENFLEKNAKCIKGRVLEIGDNEYTLRFGGDKVTKSDVLHVEDNNPKATFVGDLSNAPHLPDDSFDCIVLTQTLHLIYNSVDALRTCYRILKPGGVLLLTSPGITHIDQGDWRDYWYWSFTEAVLKRMCSEVFPEGSVITETHGNVMVATAFLWGMGQPELKKEELDAHDPHYQVIITVAATKPITT